MELLDAGKASDQSWKTKLRDMTSEQSLLSQPDGSACFNQGDTCVLAAVYGPTEIKINKELIDRAAVEVILKPKIGLPGCADKFQEKLIKDACETAIQASLHPRTSICIILQEMQNSGSMLACSVNAACLALLDGSIPLRFMVAAIACVIDSDDRFILDPTSKDEKESKAQMTFAFDNIHLNVISSSVKGGVTNEQILQAVILCRDASKEIFRFYRSTLTQKLSKAV